MEIEVPLPYKNEAFEKVEHFEHFGTTKNNFACYCVWV
jgi:hypothetical protein